MNRNGSWMLWINEKGQIEVSCSECGHKLDQGEKIPDVCPVCQSTNIEKESMN